MHYLTEIGKVMRRQTKLVFTDTGAINIEGWLQNMALERAQGNHELLREACVLAQFASEEHAAANAEPCLQQGLAMAEILAELNLDDEALAAAIIYSCIASADLNLEDIAEHLGPEVAKLVKGTQQMDAVHTLYGKLTHRTHLASTIDNLRKMLLAMVDDVRVVLIKLAERLCILRNMLVFNDQEIQRIATETMEIYAPLANRLGIGHLKWQLEDLSFRYLKPEVYRTLSKSLKERREDRELYVNEIIAELKAHLNQAGISPIKVTGRAKHIYSIYKKMEKKRVDVEEIYDALAFRLLVPTVEECYIALGIIHSLWNHIPKEFDDYIAQPKSNGYRSIHTAIEGPEGKFIEVQIRTFDMHEEAELGVAAHWVYKEGSSKLASYDQKIACLRQVMDWQKEITETKKDNQELLSHIFNDRIYVFTPHGDVIDLPAGSTPLDFAYQIHSEIGHCCRGAKINGTMVPLTHTLHSGEKVEILTAKQGHPSRDWLNPQLGYLRTPRAKAKVLNWFRKQNFNQNLIDGHDLLEKELKRLGVRDLTYDYLASKLHYKNKDDMFAAIGRGDLRVSHILSIIGLHEGHVELKKQAPFLPDSAKKKLQLSPTDISIEGVGNLLTYLAKCCKPVPGDPIVGYVTIGRGISIHREECVNLIEKTTLCPDRKMDVYWGKTTLQRYPVDLTIVSTDQPKLLQEITSLLANERIAILSLIANANKKEETTLVHLTVEINGLQPLSRLLAKISQLPGVRQVKRE